ncbi:RNF26 ligase, partial [Rhadina sibilatrix]|nr:RNF26 ligase [Rhadina sibilatrix]
LLRDLLRDLLDLSFFLCFWLLAALLCLLASAALACGAALALLRGCCAGTEGLLGLSLLLGLSGLSLLLGLSLLSGLSRFSGMSRWSLLSELPRLLELSGLLSLLSSLSAPAQRGWGAGLRCGQVLGVGSWLPLEPGKVCLAGTRSLLKLLAALWDSLAGSIRRVNELLATFPALVASRATAVASRATAVALLLLLWVPLQLAFVLLSLVTQLLTSIFYLGVYILGLLLRIAFLTVLLIVIYCNQEVLWVLKGRMLGSSRRLQPALWRLYQLAVVTWHRAISSQPWRRLVGWVLTNWSQAGRRMNQRRQQLDAGQGPQPRPALSRAGAGQRHQTAREEPGTSWWKGPRKQQLNSNAEGTPDNDPWALLKEQEERKKCVICQDQTKTVLLLPCRHLCLCQECTEVLLQQDIYQRNCPLCRQMILQTLNVYL